MDAFLQHISQFIDRQKLLPKEATLLVACSGGPDSVALAKALIALGYDIALAHVNYGLRGEDADADEAFVRKLSEDLGVKVFVKKANPVQLKEGKASLQAAARELRYAFFESLMETQDFSHCATGHTADDQAETSLLSLLRGAGPAVMHGIPPKRGLYVRPLLSSSRAEIINWLEKEEQAFRTDKSNASDTYLRNRIRHEVLPAMQRVHPMAEKRLREQQHRYNLERGFVEKVLAPYRERAVGGELDWTDFVDQWGEEHLAVLLYSVLADWGITGPAAEAALALQYQQTGTGIDTPAGRLQRTRSGLSLSTDDSINQAQILLAGPEDFGDLEFGENRVEIENCSKQELVFGNKGTHYLDLDKVVFPLCLRAWQPRDRMQPLGMKGTKLLSDIFIDQRFSLDEKKNAIILEDAMGVICISGFRISERVKVEDESNHLVRIRFFEKM
jgi:tRNA(Ile)-lysidine synthase